MKGWRSALDAAVAIAMLAVALLLIWVLVTDRRPGPVTPSVSARARAELPARTPAARLPNRPVAIADAFTKGSDQARVVIFAYSEFECPYCGRFAMETMPLLEREYLEPGKALFVFRNLPLRNHQFAFKAAEAAACAGEQGRFWPMHDLLFADQKTLTEPSLQQRALQLSLDTTRFISCLAGASKARIEQDLREAEEFGITGTPTFLIGTLDSEGRATISSRIAGARPIEHFRAAIDPLLTNSQ